MTIPAAEERAHEPGASAQWSETWHLDVATGDGIGVSVRLVCHPALGVAWWWTHVILPDRPGPVVVRDHEVTLPRQGLEIRADGLWGELICETPFEHWTYGLEAFGVGLDEPADALRGEIGERLPVGLDIEWEVEPGAGAPCERPAGWPVRGYSQAGVVRGEVLLGRSRIEIEAAGLRTHTWGVPRLDATAQSAWLHAPGLDVTFGLLGDGRFAGCVASGDAPPRPLASVRAESRERYVVDDDLEIDAEVLGLAPVPLVGAGGERAVLTRALCRYALRSGGEQDARIGNGWASRLDPE